jgi:hypothetical protein
MKVNKKKVSVLFALTLLITSLLLVSMNTPIKAQHDPGEPVHLHGPSSNPIHLNSLDTLTPIHLHNTEGFINIYEPYATPDWHELSPNWCTDWTLNNWTDPQQDGFGPNDQIELLDPSGYPHEFHIDRMTVTILLSEWQEPPPWPPATEPPTMAIELKLPYYDPNVVYAPIGTLWHEVWPDYCNVYMLSSWLETPGLENFMLDQCDTVDLTNMSDGTVSWWHVEDVATDIILREKILDPIGTFWHEIYPDYCHILEITSWESYPDPYCDRLSPKDQIDMYNYTSGTTEWYFVDRVTVTLNVTLLPENVIWMKIELKTLDYEEMYNALKHPEDTKWHEVIPNYCNVYNLTTWDFWNDDNCNGVLDVCDDIWLLNLTDPQAVEEEWHVVDITYDLIVNKKISDPTSTDWLELYPLDGNGYHIDGWTDGQLEGELGHGLLSPCDDVIMTPIPGGPSEEYHVENVTLTIEVTNPLDQEPRPSYFYEFDNDGNFSEMYIPKVEPVCTWWEMVWPWFQHEYLHIDGWDDNCNGVLDFCDNITLGGVLMHVEDVAVDMTVMIEEPPPPPPPLYWKESYPDYAPSGVPDFNQRQDLWNKTGLWTWCAPTAAADSLFWMDSRFDSDPVGSNLVTNYTAGIDDHDPQNVQPFIQHLAYLMDTDGMRTAPPGPPHWGTLVLDMEAGIAHYLSWTGVNPLGDVNGDGVTNQTDYNIALAANNTQPGVAGWNMAADVNPVTLGWPTPGMADNVVNQGDLDLINAHMNETGMFYEKTVKNPDFSFIEEEVERCEDVILLLDFYSVQWEKTYDPLKELGHAVTVAGVNSTSQPPMIGISDPDLDNAEPPPRGTSGPGRVLPTGVPHVHNATPPHTLHNNASYVSHDIYNITFIAPPPPITNATWALDKYPGPIGYPIATVEWAVIVSPRPAEEANDITVTNVTVSVPKVPTLEVYQGNPAYINITVLNNGTNPQTFNVSVYADENTTVIGDEITIANYTVTNLGSGASNVTAVTWVTSGVPTCRNYTISAYAHPVPGEANTNNNLRVDASIYVRKLGDVSGDDNVDGGDQIMVGNALWSTPGDPTYNPYADVNMDCGIDGGDQIVVGNNLWT